MIGLVFCVYLLAAAAASRRRAYWDPRRADEERRALMARIRDADRTPRIVWVRPEGAPDPEGRGIALAQDGGAVLVRRPVGVPDGIRDARPPRVWTEAEVLRGAGLE